MNTEHFCPIAQSQPPQPLEYSLEIEELDWEEFAEELSDVQASAVVGGAVNVRTTYPFPSLFTSRR